LDTRSTKSQQEKRKRKKPQGHDPPASWKVFDGGEKKHTDFGNQTEKKKKSSPFPKKRGGNVAGGSGAQGGIKRGSQNPYTKINHLKTPKAFN